MTHPVIRHLDDVLPAIADRNDFIVAHKDGYSVVDYVYALADSFDCPIRAECRGIKFGPDGTILARPLHKFKNIGEAPETQPYVLDFSQPHIIMEKLDGSMIHPAVVNDEVVFMTRMGRTDVARKAERHLTPELATVCRGLLLGGATPIFEFTAPDNRIVVSYQESRLTLLAIRNTIDGAYWPRSVLEGMGIPVVHTYASQHTTGAGFSAYARTVLGFEGFVVRFDSGLWVKAKGKDYVLKHKAKDSILQEKNILQLVLSGELDDVLPLLDAQDAERARAYRDEVLLGVSATVTKLRTFVADNDNIPQKQFATQRVGTLPQPLRPLAFNVRKGTDAEEAVKAMLIAKATSQASVDEYRPLHNARWAI